MKKKILSLRLLLLAAIFAITAGVTAQDLIWSGEAESFTGTNFAGVKITESEWASGKAYTENISTSQFMEYANVVSPTEGTYKLKIYYFNKDKDGRYVSAWANQQVRDNFVLATDTTGQWNGAPYVKVKNDTVSLDPLEIVTTRDTVWGTEGSKAVEILVYLRQGANKLKVGGTPTKTTVHSGYSPNLDRYELFTTTEMMPKPMDVPNCWSWDYTDESILITGNNIPDINNLIDNNSNTSITVNPAGNPVYITFKLPYLVLGRGCLFYLGEDVPFVSDPFQVQTSVDGEAWITQALTATDNMGQGKVFTINPAAQHEYMRLVIDGDKPVTINEFQFFGIPRLNNTNQGIDLPQYPADLKGQAALTEFGTFSASTPGLPDYKEIAVNATDRLQNKFTSPGKTLWMKYEFPDETTVKSYTLGIGAASNMNRNPKTWVLYGGDWDEVYEEVARVENFVFPKTDYVYMKFNVTNPGKYVYYKIDITSNNGAGDYTHLSEWQLFADSYNVPSDIEQVKTNFPVKILTSQGEIHFRGSFEGYSYMICDFSGRIIKKCELSDNCSVAMNTGLYVVTVQGEGGVKSFKVSVR